MTTFVWSFLNVFANRALFGVLAIVLGNYLSPHDMGVFVALFTLVTYGTTFLGLELGSALIHRLNVHKSAIKRERYYSAGLLALVLFGSVFVLSAGFFPTPLLSLFRLQGYEFLFVLMLPLVFVRLCSGYLIRTLQAESLFKRVALINVPTGLAMMLFLFVALQYGAGLKFAVYTVFIWSFIILLLLVYQVRGLFRFRIDRATYNRAIDLLKYALYIYLGTVVVFLDSKVDLLFVNYYLSKESLAVYNYAIQIAMLLNLIGASISQVNYPILSRSFAAADHGQISRVMSQSLSYGFFAAAIFALFIAFHAEYIIPLVLPATYLKMLEVLYILVAGMVIFSTLAPVGTIMTARGTPKYDLWVVSGALMVNVTLNFLLIPRYGMLGAAIATMTSFAFRGLVGLILLRIVIGPLYPYARLFFFWIFLVVLVLAGVNQALWVRELIMFGYSAAVWFLLFGSFERQQAMQKLKLRLG